MIVWVFFESIGVIKLWAGAPRGIGKPSQPCNLLLRLRHASVQNVPEAYEPPVCTRVVRPQSCLI
jgi:hypothetical protein